MPNDALTVDDLNRALRLCRRLYLRILAIIVLGIAGSIGLSVVSERLAPPYGVYLGGMSLSEWGMVATLVAIIIEFYWDGRRVGRILGDPLTTMMPAIGMMSAPTMIALRAAKLGMKPGWFMGPLRPAKKSR